ncbi:O-methyltransferase [Virgibacillus sp. W0181]|uniref:O-methyltransferase n=1 Tax=Virgibacillus sp. W0181 TaxID=3391581 RepID=UPI003F447B41
MDKVNNYLENLLPESEEWATALEKQAISGKVPIMERQSIHFLKQLAQIRQPKHLLEIGTAIGYSALQLHNACPQAQIITIERDKDRYHESIRNIKDQSKEDQIQVIFGDALEVLEDPGIKAKTFDFIFIDAAKGQYKRFFELIDPLISKDGIIVTDNVLFKGYVVNEEGINDRHVKLVKKIRNYNEWLSNHSGYITTFIPIGDGIAISLKK